MGHRLSGAATGDAASCRDDDEERELYLRSSELCWRFEDGKVHRHVAGQSFCRVRDSSTRTSRAGERDHSERNAPMPSVWTMASLSSAIRCAERRADRQLACNWHLLSSMGAMRETIQPKLYPVQHHPVRVVQTWQMAMLAAYFAGEEEDIGAPGANMGLIAMMLTKQVLDASMLSHGPNSTFTQSVQSKANEMSEALKRSVGDNPDTAVINKELELQKALLMEMGDWIKY